MRKKERGTGSGVNAANRLLPTVGMFLTVFNWRLAIGGAKANRVVSVTARWLLSQGISLASVTNIVDQLQSKAGNLQLEALLKASDKASFALCEGGASICQECSYQCCFLEPVLRYCRPAMPHHGCKLKVPFHLTHLVY